MKLTLLITEGQDKFLIGQLKEIPAVVTQGKTIQEVKINIRDAFELYLEDMRDEPAVSKIIAEEEFIVN